MKQGRKYFKIVTVEAEGKFPETFVGSEAPEEN